MTDGILWMLTLFNDGLEYSIDAVPGRQMKEHIEKNNIKSLILFYSAEQAEVYYQQLVAAKVTYHRDMAKAFNKKLRGLKVVHGTQH